MTVDKQISRLVGSFKGLNELEVLTMIKKEIDRVGITENPTQQLYQQNRSPNLAPSVSWIRAKYGYSWQDILEKLGLKAKLRSNWASRPKDEIEKAAKKFIWENKVTSKEDYMEKSKGREDTPSFTILREVFDTSFILRSIEEVVRDRGVYDGVKKRAWQFYTDDELLEFAHNEIKKLGLITMKDYLTKSRLIYSPSMPALQKRFGSRPKMDAQYARLYGEPMFSVLAKRGEYK